MKIEYVHASKFGNGAMVAEEFRKQLAARGVTVGQGHGWGRRGEGLRDGAQGSLGGGLAGQGSEVRCAHPGATHPVRPLTGFPRPPAWVGVGDATMSP